MTDPSEALTSFQQALRDGAIEVHAGAIDPELYVHLDHPDGTPRFTYGRHEGDTVTALVVLALCEPIDGVPCFQIGYAVPKEYRGQGRAKGIVDASIAELKHRLGRNNIRFTRSTSRQSLELTTKPPNTSLPRRSQRPRSR